MRIGVGIDTGGTYTDAVIFDIKTKDIKATAKSLTTKYDLSVGILGALDQLPLEELRRADIIALSTTLATNACVENKGGRAKLVLIGVDKRVVAKVGGVYGLPALSDITFVPCVSRMNGDIDEWPDWAAFEQEIKQSYRENDAVAIVEIHSSNNNAVLEKEAKAIIQKHYDIPVMCGSELSSELNSISRGASTLLNGRLIPVIQEFLTAVKTALRERGIKAPIVVVRSDGTLMSEEFTYSHPVETLLSGPAASIIGGLALTGEKDGVIVDMGGTTTDSAIFKSFIPNRAVDGIQVGKWRTFVKGLYIDTYGLGGDSAVRHVRDKLQLDESRVIPLCVLASEYPDILVKLRQLLWGKHRHTKPLHEFYVLVKDITTERTDKYTSEEILFCRALKNGPLILQDAVRAIDADLYTFKMDRLEKEGIVLRAGLTPTDIMHVKGDFKRYKTEASKMAAKFVANNLHMAVNDLCDAVYNEVKRKVYYNIVRILLIDQSPYFRKNGINEDLAVLIRESWDNRNKPDSFFGAHFKTPAALVGIGAPTHVFLPDVADALGTRCVIPPHAGVANAVGAIMGNVSATVTIDVKPFKKPGHHGYIVFGPDQNHVASSRKEAVAIAKTFAEEAALAEARSRGAIGDVTVSSDVENFEVGSGATALYIDSLVTATATGHIY